MSGKSLLASQQAWDNFKESESCWKLYVGSYDKAIGYIKDDFKKNISWPEHFEIKEGPKTITLNKADADVNMAFEDFYKHNRGKELFPAAACDTFFAKAEQYRDYHPIFTVGDENQAGWKIPSNIRGILGILTAGIHVNVYSVDKDNKVIKIWLSKRAGSTYEKCFDQIIAGGMLPEHHCNPWATLKQETREESKYTTNGRELMGAGEKIGSAENPEVIHFFTEKIDKDAGSETNHIEPGVRFCFDVAIGANETPTCNFNDKSSAGFMFLSVEEVKAELKDKKWKPNCGLVMLDFLRRQKLLDSEDNDEQEVKKAMEGLSNLNAESFRLPLPKEFNDPKVLTDPNSAL